MGNMAQLVVTIVILLTLLLLIGQYRFYFLVEKDKNELFNLSGNTEKKVVSTDFEQLPDLLVRYLKEVGVEGKCGDCHLTLRQRGRIRSSAKGKWMGFNAKQFMSAVPLGFVWAARAFPIFVKDKSIRGIGEVSISLFGLVPLGKQQSHKTNTSALARCLAELPLYPIAFLNKGITWETMSENALRAKVVVEGTQTEGIFFFNRNGLIDRFESERYRGNVLERFTGEMGEYKILSDLYVPTKLKAIWHLDGEDLEYFEGEIVAYRID